MDLRDDTKMNRATRGMQLLAGYKKGYAYGDRNGDKIDLQALIGRACKFNDSINAIYKVSEISFIGEVESR